MSNRKRRTKRRGNGDGSICQKADGTWMAVASFRRPDGTLKRVRRHATSRDHARILLLGMIGVDNRTPAALSRISVAEWLRQWLSTLSEPDFARSTIDSYTRAVTNHIVPYLGTVLVRELSLLHIDSWLRTLRTQTGDRTVQNAFVVLSLALNVAVLRKLRDDNPMLKLKRPRANRKDVWPFTVAECKRILASVKGDKFEAVYHIALTGGLRQGEIFGLQWGDIDWIAKTLRIQRQACEVAGRIQIKEPKTAAGIRTVSLTDDTLAVLRKHRTDKRPWVFVSKGGGLMRRSNFSNRHWRPLLERLGLAHRGFHHCRHTAATLMLQNGISPHIVAAILGHSKPSITMDLYAHVLQPDAGNAAGVMARLIGKGDSHC